MPKESQDIYGAMGSVLKAPNEPVRVEGTGASSLNVHANPEEFGSAIAKGEENLGGAVQDLAVKYGNMVNETQATTAEVNLSKTIGDINANYRSKSGMEAYNAYPAYQQAIQQAYADNRGGLTLGAQQAYDMTSRRLVANHIADGSGFAATQLKAANIDKLSSLQNAAMQAILDPNTATSPERVGYHIGTAIHAEQSKMDLDHPGLKTDPETGTVSFDESKPEGQQLKQQYQQNVDSLISQAKVNQFTTLAKPDVMGVLPAYDLYQKERSSLPPQAQVALDSSFAPKVFNAHKDNAVSATLSDAAAAHSDMLYNPKPTQAETAPLSVRNNNPGNLRDPSTGQFRVFDSPEAGTKAMQDDLTAKISGNSPAMEKNFGKGYSPTLSNLISTWAPAGDNNDPKAYANTVSKETGIAPDQVLTVADIPKLIPAMAKVEAGGSSSTTVQGQTELAGYNTTQPKYGVNENGAPLTQADYYRTHSADVYAKGDTYAEQTMPGNLEFKRAVRQTLQNAMSTTINNEKQSQLQDNHNIIDAINGNRTKGQQPQTEAQLRAIPGMSDLIDKVSAQDPKFAETIPTLIAKATHANTQTNSPNAYDAVRTALDRSETSSRQGRIEYLSKGLGSDNPGFSISQKDFNDTKPAVDLPDNIAKAVDKHVADIAAMNGNIDGKGQDRAVSWYNNVMDEYKANAAKGDKKMSDPDFIKHINDELTPSSISTMQQIENWASSMFKSKQTQVPTFSDPNDPAFARLPAGSQFQTPDGQIRTKK